MTTVYENIADFRSKSIDSALDIVDKYEEEKAITTNLTYTEKSIVVNIAGYVCRKTRDNLQRYCVVNNKSPMHAVVVNCQPILH